MNRREAIASMVMPAFFAAVGHIVRPPIPERAEERFSLKLPENVRVGEVTGKVTSVASGAITVEWQWVEFPL